MQAGHTVGVHGAIQRHGVCCARTRHNVYSILMWPTMFGCSIATLATEGSLFSQFVLPKILTGECMHGWWEDGLPVGPFRASEYGSDYVMSCVRIAFAHNRAEVSCHQSKIRDVATLPVPCRFVCRAGEYQAPVHAPEFLTPRPCMGCCQC
jgi:hypothetical protein